ncbi:MAG: protein DpdD [Candidatus Promineifilaceae bacterium]
MSNIQFPSVAHYQFAELFTKQLSQVGVRTLSNPAKHNIFVADPALSTLLGQLASAEVAILPYWHGDVDYWLLTATNQRDLDQALTRVQSFIIPSYAKFATPRWEAFDESNKELGQLGSQLFPFGYYKWVSPKAHRSKIIERLILWLQLERKQPQIERKQVKSYRVLAQAFDLALAANNWSEAQSVINQMRQSHLTSAENLHFLRYRLLASQQQWRKIWEDASFESLAKLRVPAAVRRVMLTAFHNQLLHLLEKQQRWDDALSVFSDHQLRLGKLLTTRASLTHAPVLRVFGYLALLEQKRATLETLLTLAKDGGTVHCLNTLLARIVPPTPPPPIKTPFETIRDALNDRDFDTVEIWLASAPVSAENALLHIELAIETQSIAICSDAWAAFESLPAVEQQQLKHQHRYLRFYLREINKLLEESERDSAESSPIETWSAWFSTVQDNPQDNRLMSALNHLIATNAVAEYDLTALNDHLLEFVTDDELGKRTYFRPMFTHFANHFISEDDRFPREKPSYLELYEIFRVGLLGESANETNIRLVLDLMAVLLRQRPDDCGDFSAELEHWITPRAAWQTLTLEAFELLANYGIDSWRITNWYQAWAIYLLDQPTSIDALSWQVWAEFGRWLKVGNNLLNNIQARIETQQAQETPTPIANLPANYAITIFSLMESSANRAKNLLLARNSSLKVDICAEKSMNDRVRSLARNCDMGVVVHRSLKHNVFYGIKDLLSNDPVYPQSRGSTSIIRAVESALT